MNITTVLASPSRDVAFPDGAGAAQVGRPDQGGAGEDHGTAKRRGRPVQGHRERDLGAAGALCRRHREDTHQK